MNYFCKIGIKKTIILLKNKKISNLEITKICLNNLIKINKKKNINIDIFYKESLNFAKKKDIKNEIAIPISIKNIYNIKNKICSCNSLVLKKFKSNYDSFIFKSVKNNNLNVLSLNKLDEFCVGGSGLNNLNINNLYKKKYIVGGSSTGSAIDLAFSCNFLSIGSDTGGSIRTPAYYCNLIGFKPTNNLLSRDGMITYSSFLDNCSILSNNVEDCEFLFHIIKKKNFDLFSNKKKIIFNFTKKNVSIIDYNEFFINLEYEQNFNKIIENFEKIGFNIIKIKNNEFNSFLNIYNTLSSKEFYSNSCKFDGIKYGYKKNIYKDYNDFIKNNRIFSKNNRNKIIKGANCYFLNNLYNLKNINYLKKFFEKIFLRSNFLILPTNIKQFKVKEEKFFEYIDIFTTIINIFGYPVINIPSNFVNHLPFGFQIISKKNFDLELLKLSKLFENSKFKNYVFN